MKRNLVVTAVLGAVLLIPVGVFGQVTKVFNPKEVGSPLELSIKENGTITVQGLRVEQLAGKSFYTKMMWGDAPMRMTVRTNDKTKFTKKNDQAIAIGNVSVGDYITVVGDFIPGSSSLDVQATTIKDWSIQTESAKYSGSISGVNEEGVKYTLNLSSGEQINLRLNGTSTITRGNIRVGINELLSGVKVLSAEGIFNQRDKTLAATALKLYQDMSLFDIKTFEGTITVISPKDSPATMNVAVDGKNYKVQFGAQSKILTTARTPISLERYLVGDKVRFSGYIQELDHSLVKATVARNMNL